MVFASCWFSTVAAHAAPAERLLDLVTFTPPADWKVEETGIGMAQRVVMTRASSTAYCMVALYASAPASTDLVTSFAAEWKSVALRSVDAVAAPAPDLRTVGNARAAVGGATSTVQGQPVLAMLIVLDAGTSVVSMLVLTPSVATFEAYNSDVQALLRSVSVRRVDAPAVNPAQTNGGRLVIPALTRPLTIADLAGTWGRNDGITTTYVDRYSGTYAGSDSLHFTEEWIITSRGEISLDFFAIRNGKKILEKSTGSVTVSAAGILAIKMSNEQRYVVRGWLVGPKMTVMTLNGPWYETIPPEILSNPEQGGNLDKNWVRLAR
ncbi:MAG: hypothetical protein ABIZ04_06355 [Opitutus sp.]